MIVVGWHVLHGFLCREDYNPFNHMDRVITIQFKLPPEADSSLDEETMLNEHEEDALRKCSEAESMVNAKAHFCFKKIMEVCIDVHLRIFQWLVKMSRFQTCMIIIFSNTCIRELILPLILVKIIPSHCYYMLIYTFQSGQTANDSSC